MGRTFLVVVAALVLGTVIGAWSPRAELLAMRGRVADMEKETRECQRGAATSGIAEILGGAGRERRGSHRDGPPEVPPGEDQAGATPEGAPDDNMKRAGGEEGGGSEANDLPNTPAAMAEALDARAAQARAALIEQVDPDEEQIAALDAAVEKMNQKLKTQVDAFVAEAAAGKEPDRREMMEFGAEALDAVIEADDAFRDVIPEDQRAEIDDETLDPFSYIDGATVGALAGLEGAGEGK